MISDAYQLDGCLIKASSSESVNSDSKSEYDIITFGEYFAYRNSRKNIIIHF